MSKVLLLSALAAALSGCSSFGNSEDVRLQYSQEQHVHRIDQNIQDALAAGQAGGANQSNDPKMRRIWIEVPERTVNGVTYEAVTVPVPVEESMTRQGSH
jgi:predicted small integral membrane protein